MSAFKSEKNVITRKPHTCAGCLHTFPEKTSMYYFSGRSEDFYTYYLCGECHTFSLIHPELCFDAIFKTFEWGGIGEARKQYKGN